MEESIQRPGSVLVPSRFKDNLSKLSSAFIAGQQEDAHEFLSCLLDNLHMCTLDPKSKGKLSSFDEESIVKQVFVGRLKSQLTCHDCGHCSETFERFLDLSLEVDQVDDLVAALESFTKVEQLGDAENKLNCESCNGQVCMDKKLVLDETPDVVVFQLKRFTNNGKIDKHVAYPTKLDLQPFHSNPNEEDLTYDLYGIVEHSGLRNFGHYMCTIRSSPSSWHLMNDSLVTSISETSALHQEAYLLFYVRQGRFPWFSNLLLQEATSGALSAFPNPAGPKRHNVFTFESLGEQDIQLVPQSASMVKKPKAASASKSSLDQNASRLMSGMTSARCFVKRLDSLDQNASLGF